MLEKRRKYTSFGYSIANFGKEKNGDSFLIERIEEEGILMAVVADGVSQQPCDWLASSTTCRLVVENFKSSKNKQDIVHRLSQSIILANKEIVSTEGKCYKMASTLSVVVCLEESEDFYFANIGDSRIYSLYANELSQLTTDDVGMRKERIVSNGIMRVVDKPVLTKVVGQYDISIKVESKAFRAGEILVLATDGFYEARKSIFVKALVEFGAFNNIEEGFLDLVNKLEILRGDDFTSIVIRKQ